MSESGDYVPVRDLQLSDPDLVPLAVAMGEQQLLQRIREDDAIWMLTVASVAAARGRHLPGTAALAG